MLHLSDNELCVPANFYLFGKRQKEKNVCWNEMNVLILKLWPLFTAAADISCSGLLKSAIDAICSKYILETSSMVL